MSAIYDLLYNTPEPERGEQQPGPGVASLSGHAAPDFARSAAIPEDPMLRHAPRPIGGASLVSRIKSLFS